MSHPSAHPSNEPGPGHAASVMSLSEFNAQITPEATEPQQEIVQLRIEFGQSSSAGQLAEGDMVTFENEPAHTVSLFDGDRLVAVATLISEEGRVGVQVLQVIGGDHQAEAA